MANITKRKDSYLIRVSCGYDIEGRKLTHSMTWKPEAGMTAKQIEKELNRQAVVFEDKCRNGLVAQNPRLTFAEFVPQYLSIKKNVLSPTTYDKYEHVLETVINPQIGHLKLSNIKPVHIQNFIKYLSETPCTHKFINGKQKVTERLHSPATVRRYLSIVQSVLNQAVKLELIPVNPAKADKLTLPKVTAPKIEIFTKQEAAEMLACLEKESFQFQVLVQLAIITGARRGELVALKFSDIDFVNNKIIIERAAVKVKGQPIAIKPPKDYEIRTIAVSSQCIELLKQLQVEKAVEREMLGDQWQGDDWIFTQWNGQIMNPMTPTKQFTKFLDKYGLEHRKFHSLRHTSATLLLYGGISLKQVQGRLGHGDIETTNKYLHYIAEADEEAANVLQNMLITQTQSDKQETEYKKQA